MALQSSFEEFIIVISTGYTNVKYLLLATILTFLDHIKSSQLVKNMDCLTSEGLVKKMIFCSNLELLQIIDENIWKPQVVCKVQVNGHPVRPESISSYNHIIIMTVLKIIIDLIPAYLVLLSQLLSLGSFHCKPKYMPGKMSLKLISKASMWVYT